MPASNVSLNQFGGSAYTRRRDVADVAIGFAAEKTSDFLKALYVLPGLAKNLDWLPSDHTGLNSFCGAAKMGKLSLTPFALFDKVKNTQNTLSLWLCGKTKPFKMKYKEEDVRKVTATDIVRDASGCVGSAWDSTEFLRNTLVSIQKSSLRVFEGINGVALIFGMTCSLLLDTCTWIKGSNYASLKGAERDKTLSQMTGYLFKMAKEISYIALGVIIVLSCFFQVVFSPLAFSAVSAATVVFNILEYYHENLGEEKELK